MTERLRVLIGCECSGVVRRAFAARGHYAVSVDLKGAEDGPTVNHVTGDVLEVLYDRYWDLFIVHPDCRYLSSSGLHRNIRDAARARHTDAAIRFVRRLLAAPVDRICLENPIGRIGTAIRPADQYIQPYQFGHDASKRTGLWLKNLEPLTPTRYVPPRIVNGRPRWANQTDSGQNKLGPSPTRAADRARTYTGIADAMADQWGSVHTVTGQDGGSDR